MSQFSFWKAVNYREVKCCYYPPDYQRVTENAYFLAHGPVFLTILLKCFTFLLTDITRVHVDNINVSNKQIITMNYKLEMSIEELISQIKVEYPYDITMCRDKYNETIQDYLYEEIISKL